MPREPVSWEEFRDRAKAVMTAMCAALIILFLAVMMALWMSACASDADIGTEIVSDDATLGPGLDMFLAADGKTVERFIHRGQDPGGTELVTVRTFDHEGKLVKSQEAMSYLDFLASEELAIVERAQEAMMDGASLNDIFLSEEVQEALERWEREERIR